MENKSYFLIILVISLLFISGCAEKAVCNKPYILVGTGCCLDQNDNKICDSDENIDVENQSIEKPKSQEIIRSDCYLPGNVPGTADLECSNMKVENKIIKLILISNKAENISIQKIELPNIGKNGCSKTFNYTEEEPIKYHDVMEYELNCDFAGEDSFYSKLIIDYAVYAKYTKFVMVGDKVVVNTINGYVEGMVK